MTVDVFFVFEILSTDKCFYLIIVFDINKVLNSSAFAGFTSFRNFVNPHPETFSFLSKEQHILMISGYIHMLQEILITGSCRFLPYSTSVLSFIFRKCCSFDV